jgi:hypothetical protein
VQRPEGFNETALTSVETFNWGRPLIWKRGEDGQLRTNVYWRVRHHSPTGFEIGYDGNGSEDLALNAMACLFPIHKKDKDYVIDLYDGRVSDKTYSLHQKFKFAFLVNADKDQGRIEWEDILKWLYQQ